MLDMLLVRIERDQLMNSRCTWSHLTVSYHKEAYQVVVAMFGTQHGGNLLQVGSIALLLHTAREGDGDDPLCDVDQVQFIALPKGLQQTHTPVRQTDVWFKHMRLCLNTWTRAGMCSCFLPSVAVCDLGYMLSSYFSLVFYSKCEICEYPIVQRKYFLQNSFGNTVIVLWFNMETVVIRYIYSIMAEFQVSSLTLIIQYTKKHFFGDKS